MRVAAILPCYKSKKFLPGVVANFGDEVERIYLVDDACPEQTVSSFMASNTDPRVKPIYLSQNSGVGGAVMAGYREALDDGMDVMIKVDSDGQMDPRYIPVLVSPILRGRADYTKGNRFYSIEDASSMPRTRFIGNFFLSFITKASSGYWNVFDPTNGFTAIHRSALSLLPLDKIEKRYFFESDMLFRLGTIDAVVQDAPMLAKYGDEVSGLDAGAEIIRFGAKHVSRFFKRIAYRYFLRGMSGGTLFLLGFILLGLMSLGYSALYIGQSTFTGQPSSPGEVMVGGVLFLLSFQMGLAFLLTDIQSAPVEPLQHRRIAYLHEPLLGGSSERDEGSAGS